MGELILWKQITAELNGHTVTGLYSASREGLVTVRTPYDGQEPAVTRIEQYFDR
jgi:hypothetical protein